MSRALLVDSDCIVKEVHRLDRRPNFRIAVRKDITFKNFHDSDSLANITQPDHKQFDFCFREDDWDVYTRNTKIIPFFRWQGWKGSGDKAVKLDINAREIVETVISKRISWMMSLFRDRQVTEKEIQVACEVMTDEIISEICI